MKQTAPCWKKVCQVTVTSIYTVVYNSPAQLYPTIIWPVASQGWHQVQNSSDNKVTQTITLVMAMPLGSTTNVNKHVILCEMGMIPQLNSCIFQVTKTLGQDVLDHDAKALLSPPSCRKVKRVWPHFPAAVAASKPALQSITCCLQIEQKLSAMVLSCGTSKMQWIASGGISISF